MRKSGGSIVNCMSECSRVAQRVRTPHHVSKAAIEMMSRCMALQLGRHNIRVNSIGPGLTETDTAAAQIAVRGRKACILPDLIKHLGLPMDTAHAALSLASDRASWISGSSLVVDGGYSSR
jgi:NAD(P)-dependent dehydrogenase (short-subunit alcohol dehydrogenase family)